MSYGENKHFEHLKLPVTWAVIGIVVVICIIAALMFLGDRHEEVEADTYGTRAGFDRAAEPVNGALSAPVHVVGAGTNWLEDYFFAVRENRILKKKVAQLSQYRDLYVEERDINARYEKLLNLRTEPPVETVTARTVLVSRGPFNKNRLIDAGADRKITFGNPVITDQGLVGRVVGVSPHVGRVLMITDVTSHVPIMVMRSDARAMLNGDGGDYPKLDFVRGKDAMRNGDQILTSGDGGIFPRGLPVGEAVRGVDGVWRARLYANRAPIDFVKVLLFRDFSNLPNADQLLRAPPVSQVLPPPQMPKVAADVSAGAVASSNASVSVPKPATATAPANATPVRPAPVKPAVARPAAPKPAATSSSSATAESAALRPFVPPPTATSSAASAGGGHQ